MVELLYYDIYFKAMRFFIYRNAESSSWCACMQLRGFILLASNLRMHEIYSVKTIDRPNAGTAAYADARKIKRIENMLHSIRESLCWFW